MISASRHSLMPFDGGLELFLVVSTILNNNKTVGLPMTEGDKDLVKAFLESFSEFKDKIEEHLSQYDAKQFDGEIKELSIDIETHSSYDIANGVYKYVEALTSRYQFFYSINRGAVLQIDPPAARILPR